MNFEALNITCTNKYYLKYNSVYRQQILSTKMVEIEINELLCTIGLFVRSPVIIELL